MIRSLTGPIEDSGENWVVVNVHGVGYLVNTPTAAQSFDHHEVTFHTYLAVRETALDLYGFLSKGELEMFELLLGAPKVGPKSALQILCQATPTLLIEAAMKNDGVYLHKLSGLGKKTAENVVSHLSSKCDRLPSSINTTATELSDMQTDAIDALVALGYDQTLAQELVRNVPEEVTTINAIIVEALRSTKS